MIRKIQTKEDREKIQRRNIRIISIILGAIMLFSTAGYFISDFSQDAQTNKKVTYNGLEFTQTGYNSWKFTISGYNFETRFTPEETSNVTLKNSRQIQTYSEKPLYFSGEPFLDISQTAIQEISRNLGQFVLRVNMACIEDSCANSTTYPLKTCSDNIIVFKKSLTNYSEISERQNCTIIMYSELAEDEERTADAFIFRTLGVK